MPRKKNVYCSSSVSDLLRGLPDELRFTHRSCFGDASGSDVLGDDATIEKIGPPEKVINAFGPEVIGENVEGKVLSMQVAEHMGRTYYQFELEPPHVLITATAAGNRLYLFNVTANGEICCSSLFFNWSFHDELRGLHLHIPAMVLSGLQWKKHYKDLKRISDSFRVV